MSVPTVGVAGVPDPLPEGLAVLDVREPVEWAYGHIDGALHIPIGELPARLDEVPERADPRGLQGRRALGAGGRRGWIQQGRDVVNLDGGMLDWEAAGRAMVSETGQPPLVV